jgi:hypothetical protein
MTIVVARKFGDRIVMFGDTMITHPGMVNPDIIPGQVKSVILNLQISMGFSGKLVAGLDACRMAKKSLESGGRLSCVIDVLKNHSKNTDCDFIIISHQNGPELFKIKDNKISESQSSHWIGDSDIVNSFNNCSNIVDKSVDNILKLNPNLTDCRTPEIQFFSAISHFFATPTISNEVGGFATNLLGSPYGHCYQMRAGVCMPGPMVIGEGPPHPDTPPQGGDRYAYHFLAPNYRGVAIVGAFFEEANLGFIYNPLEWDHPKRMRNTTTQAVQEEIDLLAAKAGGKPESDC